jgi:hypothetical protein
MKIAIINNLYKPYARGGSERVIELAVEKLKQDHQILVLTTQPENVKDNSVDGNLRICRYNPFNLYYILDVGSMPDWRKMFWNGFDLVYQ